MKTDILVIGAGPAGMMAALTAADMGENVVLAERNERIARKLGITGAGRCNITNQADVEELIANIPGNGRFLYSAFRNFGVNELMNYFEQELHISLKVERGRRVFPESDEAGEVVGAFAKKLKSSKIELLTSTRITRLQFDAEHRVEGVISDDGRKIDARAVIVATGGVSYPGTGSTGDGYRLAKAVGHTVIDPVPSLVPLESVEEWPKRLQGLSLVNVSATSFYKDQKLDSEFGEMLFTHFGVSGPMILSMSRKATFKVLDEPGSVSIVIDLKPALSETELDARIQRDFAKYIRKIYQNSLDDLLPQKLIPVIIELSAIDPLKPVHQITREERLELVKLLKNLRLTIARPRPIAEAIITAGGVSTKEINPKTMESKVAPGLYFAGEIIDVDAYTGGYNLQIAFSTGYLAGREAARQLTMSSEQ
jgi:predicted Rossmann fold flavoprotein